jgi:hypothetical protein
MVEYLPSIAQVEVAAAGRAAHEMFGFIFWLVAYAARAILATAAQHHAGHIVAWARESSCACFRAMECRSPWRPSRPRISNSTRRRGPGRREPCEFLMFGTADVDKPVAVTPWLLESAKNDFRVARHRLSRGLHFPGGLFNKSCHSTGL